MIYWSMLGDKGPDIICYAYANEDFTGLTTVPKQLYCSTSNAACTDGNIIYKDGKYHPFFKNEDESKRGIMQAVSDSLTSSYKELEGFMNVTDKSVEGSSSVYDGGRPKNRVWQFSLGFVFLKVF